uniref:WD_REPEATS_REGION domain-containing protein n=1 Tax=Steinernema glaseri TaxID=37863 RepID=A0A1I7YCY5_9BILA
MKLTPLTIQSFTVAKAFSDNSDKINSLDYSADGKFMVASSHDDSIAVFNCDSGTSSRTIYSKKYGADLIRFAHTTDNAIHCSTKVDDTIRYMSLHDNKYIRYFFGHTKQVVTLCMSPVDDTFLSGSLDKTIRLWDLRSQNCQGLMQVPSRPIAAFDPEGLIFAAGLNSEVVKLYDLRSFDKGPFLTFNLDKEKEPDVEWRTMQFSPTSKTILITTNSSDMLLIDAFEGNVKARMRSHPNSSKITIDASFTPDAEYIFCSSSDQRIFAYSGSTGALVHSFQTDHPSSINCVKFNPRFSMLSTACNQLRLWIPTHVPEIAQ